MENLHNSRGAPPLKVTVEDDSTGGRGQELSSSVPQKELLPEIWEGILEDLSPKDFLVAINSSVKWNQLMHHKKPIALMPLVIPLLMEYLPLNTMLGLRLVDKSIFKHSINQLIQTLAVDLKSAFEYKPERVEHSGSYLQGKLTLPSKLALVNRRYNFGFTAATKRFLSQVFPPPSCASAWSPILSKQISITHPVRTIGDSREGEEALVNLLTHFGHHVSSLHLDFAQPDNEIPLQLHKLQPTLALVPNLKILKLNSYVPIPTRELRHLRPGRLPNLPQLEYLSVIRFKWEENDFCDPAKATDVPVILPLIQKYGTQLKALSVGGTFLGGREAGVELLNGLLPNLKFLKVHRVNLQTMIKLGMVDWRLETLQLLGVPDKGHPCCRVGHLINVMNNFGESLTSLEILIRFPEREKREEKDKVESGVIKALPKLKTLTTAILNMDAEWFWEILTKESVPVLEEIHFQAESRLREYRLEEVLENDYTTEEFKRPFEKIPSLKKVVVWYETKRRLEIVRCRLSTCSDATCRGFC